MLVTLLIAGVPEESTVPETFPADTPTLARNSSAALPTHTSNVSTTSVSSGDHYVACVLGYGSSKVE